MSLSRLPQVTFIVLIALFVVVSAAVAAVEIPLAPPRFGPSNTPAFRFGTAVASSGHGYLVAWEERSMEYYPPGTIMVRAFDESGSPLRAVPTVIGYGLAPSIAWNGREYLVVMGERGSRFGSVTPLPVAAMVRVSEDGTPIDLVQVVVANETNAYTSVTSVAWNGASYLVCWSGYTVGAALISPDLQIRRIDISAAGQPTSVASDGADFLIAGTLPDPLPGPHMLRLLPISAAGEAGIARDIEPAWTASLTAVDGSYELLWSSRTGLRAARAGSELHPITLTTSPTLFERVAAANGAVVASWTESPHSPSSNNTRVCTARLDLESQPVCSEENDNRQHDPSIGAALGTYLLAWSDRTDEVDDVRIEVVPSYALPHAASGEGRIVSEAAAAQGPPSMERRADGGVTAVWSEINPSTRLGEIRIGGLDPSGVAMPDRAVAPDGGDQNNPRISLGGNRALVLWREGTLGLTPWIATVVGITGPFSSPPVVIVGNDFDEAVAFDGNEWLVVSGGIQYTIIDLAGRVLQTGSIDQPSYATQVEAVTGVNGGFVIAWSELRNNGAQGSRIVTSRIAKSGQAGWQASAPLVLDDGGNEWGLSAPSVAANGNRVLVTWAALSGGGYGGEVRQALLDDQGTRVAANVAVRWSPAVYRTRSRPSPSGFATLVSTGIVLTSLDGKIWGTIDLSQTYISDFLVNGDDRFTIAYNRYATPDESFGNTYRAFIRSVVPTRGRPSRMR